MRILSAILLLAFVSSCQPDQSGDSQFEVKLRIDQDPGQVNPFYAPTSIGREVYQYIFVPLADYHPSNLKLYPVLVEALPEAQDTLVDNVSYVSYDIDIKDDALWSDGEPVINRDYLFTMQMIMHPESKITAWKPYFSALRFIELDPEDETRLTVFFDPDYMLSKEAALTTYLMPSHILDPDGLLVSKSNEILVSGYETSDSMELKLVEEVNATVNQKKEIVQPGPYRISDFQTDEYFVLEAVENYWGKAYSDNVFLQQNPKKIIFRIVPDEITAVNMAKDGQLDFINFKNSNTFLELREDSVFADQWSFHTPQLMRYYYLVMNNNSGLLADRNIRKALSYLADVNDYINNIEGGLGSRTIGHFHPSKSYYNNDIDPVPYDPEEAERILHADGWKNIDDDGILDKEVDGKLKHLELELLITGSELSQKLALLFQTSCADVGVKINIVTKKTPLMRSENINVYNYDLAAVAASSSVAPDDPYSRWHSDNAVPGTRNETGYSNPELDRLIDNIRTTRNDEEREKYYLEFQEIMHEDYPVIFLYCPNMKFIISKRLNAETSSKRPGYMANTFELAD